MLIRLWGATCNCTVVHGNCILGALSQLRKRGWNPTTGCSLPTPPLNVRVNINAILFTNQWWLFSFKIHLQVAFFLCLAVFISRGICMHIYDGSNGLVLCKHCSCVGGWKTLSVLSNLGVIFLIRQCVVSIFSNVKRIWVKHLQSLFSCLSTYSRWLRTHVRIPFLPVV